MAIHSSILAWRTPMDRGVWWAIVHGVAKELDTVEETQHMHMSIFIMLVTEELTSEQEEGVNPLDIQEKNVPPGGGNGKSKHPASCVHLTCPKNKTLVLECRVAQGTRARVFSYSSGSF